MTPSITRRHTARWSTPILLAAVLIAALTTASSATHDQGVFELDKNASNDTSTAWVGWLVSNVNATATSLGVCQTGPAPAAGDTILIRAERMTVTNPNAGGAVSGSCPGAKRVYTVVRGVGGTTARSQSGGANNVGARITLITAPVSKPGPDWNQVHAAEQADPGATNPCASLGLDACTFIEDGIGPTTFTGGSTKDHLPIEGWKHTSGASPDKGEILNAYAARATNGDGDSILTFGMDRYAVDGSTDIGFWFFQNPVEAITSGPNAGSFSGTHEIGDLLILGTFTQGGATSNVRIFKWVGTGGTHSGSLNLEAEGQDCVPGTAGDTACATVNDTSIEVPWNYTFKGESVGGWVPAGGFFEGGVNLTDEGLAGCFSSFLAESRSSPEVTAVLNDFALGAFEACDSGLTTSPADGDGELLVDTDDDDLPDTSIGAGSASVRDAAELNIAGIAEWSGTMDFYLCGPDVDLDAGETCDADTGTKVGASIPVDEDTPMPVLSAATTVTSVGTYCWAGYFDSNTEGVPDAADTSAGECFEVLPVTPSITTEAVVEVEIGEEVTDDATLSGTATQPGDPVIGGAAGDPAGGTITFHLYGPYDDDTDLTTACAQADLVFTSDPVTVSGDGTYTSPAFTPTAAGLYAWIAVYSGDAPNTLGVSGACGDEDEATTVTPRQPSIETNATAGPVTLGSSIDDVATLSGTSPKPDGTAAGGTITFRAYGPFDDTTTCTGTAVYTSAVDVSGDGDYTASDGTGGTFTPTAPGTYNWIASYSGDAPNTLPVSGLCGDANESSVVIQLQPDISTAQSFVPNDAATITVASGGGNLAGTVVFRLYVDDDQCAGTPAYTSDPIDVSSGSGSGLSRTVVSDNGTAYDADATFHWTVTYTSTNTGHGDVTSACGVEHSSITIVNDGTPNAG